MEWSHGRERERSSPSVPPTSSEKSSPAGDFQRNRSAIARFLPSARNRRAEGAVIRADIGRVALPNARREPRTPAQPATRAASSRGRRRATRLRNTRPECCWGLNRIKLVRSLSEFAGTNRIRWHGAIQSGVSMFLQFDSLRRGLADAISVVCAAVSVWWSFARRREGRRGSGGGSFDERSFCGCSHRGPNARRGASGHNGVPYHGGWLGG